MALELFHKQLNVLLAQTNAANTLLSTVYVGTISP
jgi:hypothetical protein